MSGFDSKDMLGLITGLAERPECRVKTSMPGCLGHVWGGAR